MRSTLARRVGRLAVGVTAATGLLLGSAAQAQVEAPPTPVVIGANTTISGVTMNGDATTLVKVAPGSTVAFHANVSLPPEAYYSYQITFGVLGASTYTWCTAPNWYSGPSSFNANFDLTAPSVAGIYDIGAAMGPDPCPWWPWVTEPVVARMVVVDYPSLCALVQSDSSDPAVAQGLCDKLRSASAAEMRGQLKTKANILGAFANQVRAQRGKALTGEQADLLLTLAGEL